MGQGQEPRAAPLTPDRLCRKGCFAQDTRATAIVFFLGTNCMLFFAGRGENGFGHRSLVPKILKSLMLQRPGSKTDS